MARRRKGGGGEKRRERGENKNWISIFGKKEGGRGRQRQIEAGWSEEKEDPALRASSSSFPHFLFRHFFFSCSCSPLFFFSEQNDNVPVPSFSSVAPGIKNVSPPPPPVRVGVHEWNMLWRMRREDGEIERLNRTRSGRDGGRDGNLNVIEFFSYASLSASPCQG